MVSEAVIRIRGNLLMKKSPPKKWKKRYFTLRGTTIYYHDKERDALGDAYDASAKGSMPLGDCMVAQTDEFPKEVRLPAPFLLGWASLGERGWRLCRAPSA